MTPEPHAMLNALSVTEARVWLSQCCGASRWVEAMLARRPFASQAALHADAEAAWEALGREDFLEAFAHHPRIGARARARAVDADAGPGSTLQAAEGWSDREQARVADAGAETREELHAANEEYVGRFGYIFIVCATGKSAAEMLSLLRGRLSNEPARELEIAAAEQARITRLRLDKLGQEQDTVEEQQPVQEATRVSRS